MLLIGSQEVSLAKLIELSEVLLLHREFKSKAAVSMHHAIAI